jgi:hypothetical protein
MNEETIVNKGYLDDLGTADLIALPIYVITIIFIARIIKLNNIANRSHFKYFTLGLYAKIIGSIVFCLVFTYYYKGGDTISYFESTRAMANLFWENPSDFFKMYFSGANSQSFSYFSFRTGYPWGYIFFEPHTNFLTKLFTPILILCFNSYVLSTIVLAVISYVGVWKMFDLIVSYYPKQEKPIAIGFLFVPTVVFWGSGMLKDTVTLSALCWLIVSIDKVFIRPKSRIKNLLILFLSSLLILNIKPYILMNAIPGAMIWVFYQRIQKLKNPFFRYATIPFILIISITGGFYILSVLGSSLGKFSLDKILETAVVSQEDLKRDYYKGSSFDIGKIEPTVAGFIAKSPEATVAGLFRPFLWEARKVVIFLSGLENFAILIITIVILFRLRILKFFKLLFDNPLVLFLMTYSVFFAFSIGISTSNFGALIRFKIAFAPFFISSLLILLNLSRELKYTR